jgi:hypothetical protein
MAFTLTGADQIGANGLTGAFYWPRPNVITRGSGASAERWAIILDTTGATWRLRAYLRDNSSRSWTQYDSGSGPTASRALAGLASPFACPTYIRDPANANKIICAYPRSSDATLAWVRFDMAGRVFETPTTGGPQAWGVDFPGVAGDRGSLDDTGAKVCVAYRASDNKLVFNYQGPPEFVVRNHARPWYVTYDLTGAAWGTAVQLAGAGEQKHYDAHGIVVDDTGEIHCTIIKPTDGSGAPPTPYELWHVAIDPDDTIHAKDVMTTDVRRQQEPYISYPVLRAHGATQELMCSFKDEALGIEANRRAKVVRGDVGVAPAWSTETVSTSAADSPLFDSFEYPEIAIFDDGTPYVFWFNDSLTDVFYRMWVSVGGDPGAGWSAPLNIFTCVQDDGFDFLESISVSPIPGVGFGIVAFFAFCTAGGDSNAVDGVGYWEYGGAVVTALFPEYVKRRSVLANN